MELKWLWVLLLAFLLRGWCECEGCWEHEKTALLQLKPFFSHIEDVRNYWVDGKRSWDCCEWKRVECNTSTGRVIQLFLNQTYVETLLDFVDLISMENVIIRDYWYLNASLFLSFEELKSLYLNSNSITGCVDDQGFERLSKLEKLEILDLTDNYFNDSILISLSELSSLKALFLGWNQFIGSNPTNGIKSLSKLNKLETLDLLGNKLGNNILSHLDGFSSLKSLRLENCGLKGTIDMIEFNNQINLKELYFGQNEIDSLGSLFPSKGQLSLTKLEVLGLNGNLFNNSIFSCLVALSNLKILYLKGNRLEGSIYIKDLNALRNLEELYLWDNQVNNFVPSQDNETKLRLNNLKVLDLTENNFNSSIFVSLSEFSNLRTLSLDVNDASINLRGLDALSNLEELYIGCYDLEVQDLVCSLGPQSLVSLPSLKTVYFHGVSFIETMATQKSNIFRNLEELHFSDSSLQTNFLGTFGELTSLKRLGFYECEINGASLSPPQEWKILTSLEELTLETSSLPSNFIQDIRTLTSLKSLLVSSCDVNGRLTVQGPLHLRNLESLLILDTSLENNFLQKIGAMPFLKILRLRGCGIKGTLSTQGFCELTNLQNLDLSYNNLMDSLPECFFNLTFLKNLDVSFNLFFGNISALRNLKSLRKLSLSNNNFEIPSSLGPLFNLSKLHHIHADNNTIYVETEMHSLAPTFQLKHISLSCCGDVGSFPQFLYHQHYLRYVDLSNIYFKAEQVPIWLLENNTNLQTLFVANNSFLGNFKLPFLPHTDLLHLDISRNSFYGNIPNEIGAKLPSLSFLNMSKNSFGGNIPVSISYMNHLQILDLSNNKLTGDIPRWVENMSGLTTLDLSNNKLSGGIPMWMGNLSSLITLDLSNNKLSGGIPRWMGNMFSLITLDLSNNKLSGGIPKSVGNMSSLITLDLSNNKISGGIPKSIGNMSSLKEILMANNHLEGQIPMEFCQLNFNLQLLDLSVNNISGSLPSCFSPSFITQVHLSRNKLEGPLTNAFRDSNYLVTLDLSNNQLTGSIPNWIGQLFELSYLVLSNNNFEGEIPVELCKLGHLSLIDLSNNNLSGTIPPCLRIMTLNDSSQAYDRYAYANFSNSDQETIEFATKNNSYFYKGRVLTLLSGIDLSCNKLSGEIPHQVINFPNIPILNLSHNILTGQIPSELSELRQIESLDLSYNNLSGKIPPQLVGLSYLSFFSVAYNNLSGSTPERTAQFATFDESSYLGNPFLCGAPLLKNCSTYGSVSSSADIGLIDMNIFYISFAVSYVMVILSIACVLFINPCWRMAWFYYIEVGITSCHYFLEDYILPKRFHCGNM